MHILSSLEQEKNNNFNIIRLAAAVMVVFHHSFPLCGIYGRDLGDVAVLSFFTLSGFLITKSYLKNDNVYSFIEARILRLLPGYLLCLIYSILIGLLVTTATFYEYIFSSLTFFRDYIIFLWVNRALNPLIGVYTNNPFPEISNGSLWSLPGEVRMYMFVLFFGFFKFFNNRVFLHSFFLVICLSLYFLLLSDSLLADRVASYVFRMPWYGLIRFPLAFVIGMYAYLYKDYIPISPFILIGLLVLYFCQSDDLYFYTFVVSYIVLFLGFYPKILIKKLMNIPDYSYGIYIYSFPTQQTIVSIFKIYDPYLLFFISLPTTLIVAAFSWHYVEKPSLRLKGKTLNLFLPFKERFMSVLAKRAI